MKLCLKFAFIISFLFFGMSSCTDVDKAPESVADQGQGNFKNGSCVRTKTITKYGYIAYTHDTVLNVEKQIFYDSAGISSVTEYFYSRDHNNTLDSIKRGNKTWTLEQHNASQVYVNKYVNGTLKELYVWSGLDKGGPNSVNIYDVSKGPYAHTSISFEYDENNNMTRMVIEEDFDLDQEIDKTSSIEYDYYEKGYRENHADPEIWLNPFGGENWSQNPARKAKFKDGNGNVTTEVEYNYEFNEYGYPISKTVHGKTTQFEWKCQE